MNKEFQSFNLNEIFSSNTFKWYVNDDFVCLQIVAVKQELPIGFVCSEITLNQIDGSRVEEDKRKIFTGDLSYEVDMLSGASYEFNHSVDYTGSINLGDIPLSFQGYHQKSTDPSLGSGISNFSFSFDVQRWKDKMFDKVDEKMEAQKDSLLSKFPDHKNHRSHLNYAQRVLKNPRVVKELDAIEKIPNVLDSFDLTTIEEVDPFLDSLYEKSRLLQKINPKDSLVNKTKLDSLQRIISEVREKIALLEQVKSLNAKKIGYDNLKNVSSKSQTYLHKVDSTVAKVDKLYTTLKDQPHRLNQYLRNNQLVNNTNTLLLNYITDFRIGNLYPDFSRLVLQGNRVRGLLVGVEHKNIGLTGFSGKSDNLDFGLFQDTISPQTNISGVNISLTKNKQSKKNIFAILSKYQKSPVATVTQGIFGYRQSYTLGDQHNLSLDIAYLSDNLFDAEKNEDNDWTNFIYSTAALLSYKGSIKKNILSWKTDVEFTGLSFRDINNPFQRNDAIELSNSIYYKPFEKIRLGVTSLVNHGNLSGQLLYENNISSNGLSVSFYDEKWPAVQYVVNYVNNNAETISRSSLIHNLNISKTYKLESCSLQSMFNLSAVRNNSEIDSLNTSFTNLYFNQGVTLSKKIRASVYFGYILSDNFDATINSECKLFFSWPAIRLEPAVAYVENSGEGKWGGSIKFVASLFSSLNISLYANSLWINNTNADPNNMIDDFDINYVPLVRTGVNYRF